MDHIPAHTLLSVVFGGEKKAVNRKRKVEEKPRLLKRQLKHEYVMIRVNAEQKEELTRAAYVEDESLSNWSRKALLRLARGWKLIPPNNMP